MGAVLLDGRDRLDEDRRGGEPLGHLGGAEIGEVHGATLPIWEARRMRLAVLGAELVVDRDADVAWPGRRSVVRPGWIVKAPPTVEAVTGRGGRAGGTAGTASSGSTPPGASSPRAW